MTIPPSPEVAVHTDAAFQAFLEQLAGDAIGRYQQIERTIRTGDVAQRESAVLLAVGSVTNAAYLATTAPSALARLQAIAVVAVTLADAALAYDRAIAQYGRQIDAGQAPAFVDSDQLDRLYLDWLGKAHALKALIGEAL